MTAVIRRLDETVVNRIAAGEVIQRPANALKELIENSLDAGSTSIQITVKEGGLKLLQIQDNGSGIHKTDLDIICERFTTSKLKEFDDLKSISTYGFRGEALASISHIAHMCIVTKTANEKCAYKVSYVDGRPKGLPKPCASNDGTQITIEDLYYNIATRRKAFKNISEEHAKIVEVVSRYAIHNASIGFTLKKHGEHSNDVKTPVGSNHVDNIRTIYGSNLSKELLEVVDEDMTNLFKLHGFVSNVNYYVKKPTFLLFINDRLVDCSALRKAIGLVYSCYIPKNSHPFLYLSLVIAPQNVDVNVHPTKHEVKFLHEDLIIERISKKIDATLLSRSESRTMYTKAFIPTAINAGSLSNEKTKKVDSSPKTTVRTDSSQNTLELFFHKPKGTMIVSNDENAILNVTGDENVILNVTGDENAIINVTVDKNSILDVTGDENAVLNVTGEEETVSIANGTGTCVEKSISIANDISVEKEIMIADDVEDFVATAKKSNSNLEIIHQKREVHLASVVDLTREIKDDCHADLKKIFQKHSFVGCVDRQHVLLQHESKLYLINTCDMSEILFYQILINDFGNFGLMKLSSPPSVFDLAMMALNSEESGWSEADGDKEMLANNIVALLKSKASMLDEYFSLEINEDGKLCSIPLLLDNYIPAMENLPMYILRLATEVDWNCEKECFQTFSQETAKFYAFSKDGCDDSDRKSSNDIKDWEWTVENVLFVAFRSSLAPPKRCAEDRSVLQVANLPDLYKFSQVAAGSSDVALKTIISTWDSPRNRNQSKQLLHRSYQLLTKMFVPNFCYFRLLILAVIFSQQIDAQENCPPIPKLNIYPGQGWDVLADREMAQTLGISYEQCRVTSDGNYLIPDDTEAVLLKTKELAVKGDLIEHWANYTPPTASGFHVISEVWPLKFHSLYHSFSEDYQQLKKTLVKDKTFICRSQLRHLIYQVHVKPNARLNTLLHTQFLDVIDAFNMNRKDKAECILETIVRDYGSHFTKTVDIGAVLIKEDFLPTSFLADHYHEKAKILSSSKASLGSFGFSWPDKHYLDVSLLNEYNKAIIDGRIRVIGGPNWKNNTVADEWLANTKKNLTLFDRSGDLLTGLITTLRFPDVSKPDLKKLKDMLGDAIRNYYSRHIYEGCTQKTAQNFDFAANIDDGLCYSGRKDFMFGGIYEKCIEDQEYNTNTDNVKTRCSNYVITNPLTKRATCPSNFEAKLLFVRSSAYKYTRPDCSRWDPCNPSYGIFTIGTYFCISSAHLPATKIYYEFGGLYSAEVDNIQTKKKSCPPYYSVFTFWGGKLSVCLSTSANESSKYYSLPFGGLTTCQTVLCCPNGYTEHFATIHHGRDIYYCIQDLNLPVVNFGSTRTLHRSSVANCSDNDETVLRLSHGDCNCNGNHFLVFYIAFVLIFAVLMGLAYWQKKLVAKYLQLATNFFRRPPNAENQHSSIPLFIPKVDNQTVE
uniref:MACPF domain-containing protein n=1 Tax=Strigamia maritima TaxID=126957 RepID=T1JAM6_STRMM